MFSFISLALTVEKEGTPLGDWQAGWTVFYWVWWVAFAPFVGMFFARISKGRTIREFLFGAIITPSLVCFIWFTFVGGTALDLELAGVAGGQILDANIYAQLYEVFNLMLSPLGAKVLSAVVVVLLLTFLVTTADSAVLVVNTINSGGDANRVNKQHIVLWGGLITVIVATLLLAGGLGALKTAMIIGALPFSLVMVLMSLSLIKSLLFTVAK